MSLFAFQGDLADIKQHLYKSKKQSYNIINNTKEVIHMAVRLNENEQLVKTIKDGLERTGGYCPCKLDRSEDNKCICKEFREQIADDSFEGYCHCMLYYKSK